MRPWQIRFLLTVVAVLLCGHLSATAQEPCIGTPDHFLVWGAPGALVVYGPVVPQTQVFLVDAVGLFSSDLYPTATEFALEVIDPVPEQTGFVEACDVVVSLGFIWRHALAKIYGYQGSYRSTPLLGWTGKYVMRKGQRLAGRLSTGVGSNKFGISGTFWRYPLACGDMLAR